MKKRGLLWKWTKVKSSSDLSKESNSYSKSGLKSKILKQVQDDISSFSRHAELGSASPKKLQYGRSMIEMIGVLAIIGVLSVGGIWGLNKAFTKHKVNNLMEDVKLAGFIVMDEMFETLPEEETSLAGRFTPSSGYSFVAFKESDVTFAIETSQISKEVCLETGKRKVDWLEEIRPNGLENTCKEGENFITFFFNAQLNTEEADFFGSCEEDADCGECGTCDGRKCVYPDDKPVKAGNRCVSCPTSSVTTQTSPISCHQCKDTYYVSGNACYNCSRNLTWAGTTKTDCLRCNGAGYNKYWRGTYENENSLGACLDCEGTVTKDGTYCDWNCKEGFVATQGYTSCVDCETALSTRHMYDATLEDCRKCDNRFFIGTNLNQGGCAPCTSNSTGQYTYKEDCLSCNKVGFNKYWPNGNSQGFGHCQTCVGTLVEDGTLCDWECGAGTYGAGSGCNTCDGTIRMSFSSLRTCRNCDNMYYSGKEEIGGLCNGCSNIYSYNNVRKADCLKCGNRTWKGTYVNENSLGTCSLCNGTVSSDGTQCITN